jgi:hypothetical protein
MAEPSNPVRSRWAERLRVVLAGAIVLMIGLTLWKAPWSGGDRYIMKSAYGNSVGAAPGMLALTLPGEGNATQNTKIYIVDTSKMVVCVYAFRNEKIRLVSAREFSKDMDIKDASDRMPTPDGRAWIKPPEGNNGFDRETAAAYAKGQELFEKQAKKKR